MSSSVSPPKVATPSRPTPEACGARCRECPYSKLGASNRPVYGEGPRNPAGLIFAESPGSEEAASNRLLVGATGIEFDKVLAQAGILRSKVFIINVIACQPVGPKSEPNMKKATECCRPFVLAQIRKFGPHPFVLTLGAWAFYALHGHKLNIDRGRGFIRKWRLADMEAVNAETMEIMDAKRKHTEGSRQAKPRSE